MHDAHQLSSFCCLCENKADEKLSSSSEHCAFFETFCDVGGLKLEA